MGDIGDTFREYKKYKVITELLEELILDAITFGQEDYSGRVRSDEQREEAHKTLEHTKDKIVSKWHDAVLEAQVKEHYLMQHQATVNMKTAKAVAGWSLLRARQLKKEQDEI